VLDTEASTAIAMGWRPC